MPVGLVARIAHEVPQVACVKLEATPTPARVAELRAFWATSLPPADPACTILSGLGGLYAGFDLEQGTAGFMTGFAFPEILLACHAAARGGDLGLAHAIYQRYLALLVFYINIDHVT